LPSVREKAACNASSQWYILLDIISDVCPDSSWKPIGYEINDLTYELASAQFFT